jgi:hypothetical protein
MEPLLAVSDGRGWLAASGDVTPLVQDALDEIEYVTGDQTTTWGAKRAADGHPAPFVLHYVEIGNEDFFDDLSTYNARFAAFYDAIRAKYPQLQIIATRGDVSSRVPDLLDDHYYRSAAANAADAHHYDGYSRTGPKIMVGERRAGRRRMVDRAGTQFGPGEALLLCAAAGECELRREPVGHEPHRVRRNGELWVAVLLRPVDVLCQSRQRGVAR